VFAERMLVGIVGVPMVALEEGAAGRTLVGGWIERTAHYAQH
jgi:hypothetical protein